ncbi:hypothetical protein GB937_004972 [Aspergillus fischeri]|nr:hypothetical protein GB937_004972 [Aspergillus fischeri]
MDAGGYSFQTIHFLFKAEKFRCTWIDTACGPSPDDICLHMLSTSACPSAGNAGKKGATPICTRLIGPRMFRNRAKKHKLFKADEIARPFGILTVDISQL